MKTKLWRHVIASAEAGPTAQKMRIGIKGSFAIFVSYQMKTAKAATPMINGASAEGDVHSLCSLAPVWRPNRKATVPPMIISTPVQSSERRLSRSKASGMSGVRVKVKIARASALMGRLIQTVVGQLKGVFFKATARM